MRLEIELTDDEAIEVAAHVLRAPSVVGRRLFMAIARALPGSPAAPVSAKGAGVAAPKGPGFLPKAARPRVRREPVPPVEPVVVGAAGEWRSGKDDRHSWPAEVREWEVITNAAPVRWTKCPEIDGRWRGLDDAGNLCRLEKQS